MMVEVVVVLVLVVADEGGVVQMEPVRHLMLRASHRVLLMVAIMMMMMMVVMRVDRVLMVVMLLLLVHHRVRRLRWDAAEPQEWLLEQVVAARGAGGIIERAIERARAAALAPMVVVVVVVVVLAWLGHVMAATACSSRDTGCLVRDGEAADCCRARAVLLLLLIAHHRCARGARACHERRALGHKVAPRLRGSSRGVILLRPLRRLLLIFGLLRGRSSSCG